MNLNCVIISNADEKPLISLNEFEKPNTIIKQKLFEIIWKAYCNNYTDFFVNCEYGIPLWSAEIICALKLYNNISLHIVIPYEEQCLRWCEEWRDRYYSVHQKADSIILSNTYYHINCYNNADEIMIDKSDMVLVFGKNEKTIYAEKYAKQKGVKIQYDGIT